MRSATSARCSAVNFRRDSLAARLARLGGLLRRAFLRRTVRHPPAELLRHPLGHGRHLRVDGLHLLEERVPSIQQVAERLADVFRDLVREGRLVLGLLLRHHASPVRRRQSIAARALPSCGATGRGSRPSICALRLSSAPITYIFNTLVRHSGRASTPPPSPTSRARSRMCHRLHSRRRVSFIGEAISVRLSIRSPGQTSCSASGVRDGAAGSNGSRHTSSTEGLRAAVLIDERGTMSSVTSNLTAFHELIWGGSCPLRRMRLGEHLTSVPPSPRLTRARRVTYRNVAAGDEPARRADRFVLSGSARRGLALHWRRRRAGRSEGGSPPDRRSRR